MALKNANISIIDLTNRIGQADMLRFIGAINQQIVQVGEKWDTSATVRWYVGAVESAPKSDIKVYIGETIDTEGLQGYHFIDSSTKLITSGAAGYAIGSKSGQPFGIIKYNPNWTITASHEILEMLINPTIDKFYNNVDANGDGIAEERILVEICDPVQAETYTIDGVVLSNWVFPEWYTDAYAIAGRQYDYMNTQTEPRKLNEGGYASYWWAGGWWQSVKTLYITTFSKLGSSDKQLTLAERNRILRTVGYIGLGAFLIFLTVKLFKNRKNYA